MCKHPLKCIPHCYAMLYNVTGRTGRTLTNRSLGFMAQENTRIRVLVAKPGLDGHDRGAKVIARAFRDAGMEVIYTGIRQTPEMIVQAASQEDVQVLGLSILSGAHLEIMPAILELLREQGMEDVLVLLGGIIPEQDRLALEEMGVSAIFGPGTSTHQIVEFVQERLTSEAPNAPK